MKPLGWFLPLFAFGLTLLFTGSKAEVRSGTRLPFKLESGKDYVFRAEIQSPQRTEEGAAPVQVDESAALGSNKAEGTTTEEKIESLAGEAERLRLLDEYRMHVKDISPAGEATLTVTVVRRATTNNEKNAKAAGTGEGRAVYTVMLATDGRIRELKQASAREPPSGAGWKGGDDHRQAALRAHLESILAPGLHWKALEVGEVYALSTAPSTTSAGEKAPGALRLRFEGSGRHAGAEVARFVVLAPEETVSRTGKKEEKKELGEAHYRMDDGLLQTLSLKGHPMLSGSGAGRAKAGDDDVVIFRRVEAR